MPDAMEISTTEVSGISPVEEEPLEQGQLASCSTAPSPMPLSTNTIDDLDNSNFNEQMLDKGMKTPSKGKKRKLVFTPPASSPSSARSSDTDKTGQDKGPKRLFPSPSPGKRWLAQIPENENTQSETIEEMAEMVQYGQVCHGPVKVSFLKFFKNFRTKRFSLRMFCYSRVSSMRISSSLVLRTTKPGIS